MKKYFDNVVININNGYDSLNKDNFIEEENLYIHLIETEEEYSIEVGDDSDVYRGVSIYDNIFENDTDDNWINDVPFGSILSILHSCYFTKKDYKKYQKMEFGKERVKKELDLIPKIYKNLV